MSKKVSTFDIDMSYLSISKAKAKEIKSLSSKKERDQRGVFLVEGEKCVLDFLDGFQVENLICSSNWIERNPNLVKMYGDKVLIADNRSREIISSMNSVPEIMAVFKKNELKQQFAGLKKDKLYLLLDEIQDPGNLGTIIRTCDWFGVYDIFASKNTVDVYSNKVIQSTMGSLTRVNVSYLDLEQLIEENPDLDVIGAILDGEPLNQCKISPNGFLLMGNEGRGVSESLKRKITRGVTIPPKNEYAHPDSLNVAIATAVILSRLLS